MTRGQARRRMLVATLGALLVAAAWVAPRAAALSTGQATALGQQAYLYGFPLLEFVRVRQTTTSVRCPDTLGAAPINSFGTETSFATPTERTIVAPNVDTLYSMAELDLGRGPVVLAHPDMGRRYFVFELLDPYTNVIAYIGSRTTGSRAGRFAITWSGHPGLRASGARVIRSAYRRVWVIGRTLAGNAADQRRALAQMRQYTVTPPGGPRRFPVGCKPPRPKAAVTPSGLAFLQSLDRELQENPPPLGDRPLLSQLAAVGVGPGLDPARAHLSPSVLSAVVSGVNSTAASLPSLVRESLLARAKGHGGWATPPADIGDYGTDYTVRAGVAVAGLGANTPAEATYPTAYTDSTGQLLTGTHSYRLVFHAGALPPVRAFWSLTMYDINGYLVPNAAHRYAVGSEHTLIKRRDGSVWIVIQRRRPTEPGVNWLPPPAGQFRLNLRLYWPKPSVLSGSWTPPPVTQVQP